MAISGQRMARIDVLIGGVEQANKQVSQMKTQWTELGKQVLQAKQLMEASANTIDYDRNKRAFDELLKDYRQLGRIITQNESAIKTVEERLGNISGQTLRELTRARRDLDDMLRSASPADTKTMDFLRQQLRLVGDEIKKRKGDLIEFSDVSGKLGEISDRSLSMVKQRLQELVSIAGENEKKMSEYREQLKKIGEEEERRQSSRAGAVMGNLGGSSVAEIQEAIKVTERLRDAQKLGSGEWEIYNDEIQRAKQYIEEFNRLSDMVSMESRMSSIGTASNQSLAEMKKFWQAQVDGAQQGSAELENYRNLLRQVTQEEERRASQRMADIMDNPDGYSITEIQEAIKVTERLRDAQKSWSGEWEIYNEQVRKARQYLDDFNKNQALGEMNSRMASLGTLSAQALEELKKFWQTQVDGAENGSRSLKDYMDMLSQVEAEEGRRLSARATNVMGNVQAGTFSGTIAETKEAIKLLEQYRQQLQVSDVSGIKTVDDAISQLNEKLKQTAAGAMTYEEAMRKASQLGTGGFTGTYGDLERMRKTLDEYRKSLIMSGRDTPDELKKIREAFRSIEDAELKVKSGAVDIDNVLKNLSTSSMEDLKAAAAQLQQELNRAGQESDDFVRKSAELRRVNAQIDRINKAWKEHDNQIVATAKRLTSYVLVYTGFNEVVDRIQMLTSANLELSDSMADIQKTTGLTKDEVAELSHAIDSIDTRASQKELHDLAYEAGKLGISAEDDVLQFVRAGDQIITALGDELGGAEAVRSLMKINDLLGETSRLGVEKALLATGSAMNELSNLSTASAGPMADIVSRLGAVGAQARLSMADLIALGGTADELSQEVEVTGTALSKFVTALQTNTHAIAQAIGVDDKQLENLMEAGKTMEAIILVLRRMQGMGGLKEIDPIMKEFGSDGERLNRVVTALASNVDTLEKRVVQSREAFAEATSVTDEYNVMNESAMALVQRLGNMILEAFVNSGVVTHLTNFLKVLMDIPRWIQRNHDSFVVLTSVISGLTTALVANQLQWVKLINQQGIIQSFLKARAAIIALGVAMRSSATYTGLLSVALSGIKKLMATNWLTLLISGITAAGIAVYQWTTYISDAAKAMGEFNANLRKEQMQVDALFDGLKNLNTEEDTRRKLIEQINNSYGQYLGFMLSEKDNADKLAAAHDLINARLRERMALQLQSEMTSKATEKYASPIQDALSGMAGTFEGAAGITASRSQEAMNIVQRIVSQNIAKPMDEILVMVRSELAKTFDTKKASYGSSAYFDIQGDLKDFIEAQKSYRRELSQTESFVKNELNQANSEVIESSTKVLNTLTAEYNTLKNISTAEMDERALKEHNSKMLGKAQEYVNVGTKLMEKVSGTQRESLQKIIDSYKEIITELTPQSVRSINVWGEGLTLESASVDQLVEKYKQLFNERKTLREDASYDTVYSKQFKDRKEAMEWYLKQLDIIKKRLNEMGYNEQGNFLKQRSSGRRSYSFGGVIKTAQEIKEESTAALSALEAYFNREKQLINQSYIDREITEEERNDRLLKKEEEFLRDRIALRRKLLGREGGEAFAPGKYVQTDTETGETTEYFKGKNLDQLSGFIRQMGQAMTDGILNQLTIDELKIMQATVERMKKIQKIILDNDFTGQVDKQYQDQLEQLKLFWGKEEEVTVEGGERRLAYLRMLSKDAYNMDSAGLEERMSKYEEFHEWMRGRTGEEYQALLLLLQKYYDDTEEADNREMQRRQRITQRLWEKTGQETAWDTVDKRSERDVSFMSELNTLGLASDRQVDDAQIRMYENRLLAAQTYYDFVEKNGGNLEEAEQKRNEAYQKLSEMEMEVTKNKLETLKDYTDAVVDFSAQMGEAAFGEVSDRKEAAKQLLQTTMNLTKQLIMQRVQELITKRMLKKQEELIETAGDANILQSKGSTLIGSLSASQGAMTGKITAGIAGGSAKIIEELGWWGIPLIAVITAALNALMGLAMSSFNKSKGEVAAVTGVSASKGRVAAGMLTYAKGDYPVLGNDGKVYNATYQKELKTGIYRGGAHFGIFSEKKPEMIVDGNTTQKLILNYPHIYESILTIARNGRLKSAMPTYAEGSYPAIPSAMQGDTGTTVLPDMQMRETLAGVTEALSRLTERLNQPINATVDPYGKKGAVNQLGKANNFMKKRGLV